MKSVIAWFVGNGVAANLLMVFIIVAGLLTTCSVKQEVFPEISVDLISVTIPYPGAAPEEVEEGVVVRVEEAIQDLEGIDTIRSTSAENIGSVLVEILDGEDVQKVLDDVKSRVDAIDTFPDEAEEPVIEEVIRRTEVLNVAIAGRADERTLKTLGERVRDEISALPGVTQVELVATRPYEVSIEVSEAALRRHNLTFQQVAQAVRASSLDLPGGRIRSLDGEILLRTEGQAYSGRDFEELPLLTLRDGSRVSIGDVATVVDGFADTDSWARFDGQPAVLVKVYRVGAQGALDVAEKVKDYVASRAPTLPEGIQLTVWQDDTRVLRGRLELLLRNGTAGFILVLLVLALFLKLQLAGWVALGIPISFLGAVALMPISDVSVNVISLFAFIIVLGIVVDDAIIVGENVFTSYESGKEGASAAIDGTYEVTKPVVFAVLTSIAAFSPLLFVSGNIGKIMRVVPTIVIATLVFSLVESLIILPHHLSHLRHGGGGRIQSAWRNVQKRIANGLDWTIRRTYQPSLRWALRWRLLSLALALSGLMITFGVVAGGWIKFNFFPSIEADNAAAMLTFPQGTPATVTAEAIQEIEASAIELASEMKAEIGQNPIRHVQATVGDQPFRSRQSRVAGAGDSFAASHLGEVNLELMPAEDRLVSSKEIASRWRQKVGVIPDVVELSFTSSLINPGEAINIELSGPSLEELRSVAARIKEELRSYPGVQDIADSYRAGKKELELAITREGQLVGLTQADVARQVRQAFYGEEAQRIQRGRDDVKVMVRLPDADRRSLADLETLRIRTADGVEVPLSTAAVATLSRGPAAILRTDRNRVINVTADVDVDKGNPNEILAALGSDFLPGLLADHPGMRFSFEGEQEEQRTSLADLRSGFAYALLVIYALLAIPFRSYTQPLIVMSAIPFGVIGAIWGHLLLGYDLAILSLFGIVALTGVVVNDSLVMVDFINRSFRAGVPLREAIERAGTARFRPILLTSLTTFAGLTPLLLERSLQAQFLIPMAISLAFGVLFATFITLILVPLLYSLLEDLRSLVLGLRRHPERPEPAATLGAAGARG